MEELTEKLEVHWTHQLFVENAELYLPFLEREKDRAQQEIQALFGLFTEFGVPSGGRILDLACGIGRHSVLLSNLGYDVTGIDISPLFVEKAREYAVSEKSDARFVLGDALDVAKLLTGEKPFDACVNMFTSHSYYGREGDIRMFRSVSDLLSGRRSSCHHDSQSRLLGQAFLGRGFAQRRECHH